MEGAPEKTGYQESPVDLGFRISRRGLPSVSALKEGPETRLLPEAVFPYLFPI